MEKVNSLYRGGMILLLGFIFVKVGGLLFKIICMVVLPLGAYGEVAVFMVLFNWFVLFATLNISIGLAKFVSQDRKNKGLYFSSALLGCLLLSLAVSVIIWIFSPIVADVLNIGIDVIHWSVLCIPFAVLYNLGIFYFRGLYEMKSSTIADIFMMAVRIVMLAAFLVAGLYYAPFIAFLISFMAIDTAILIKNRKIIRLGDERIRAAFKSLILFSVPVFISEFMRSFSTELDRLVISGFYSSAQAGIYDVAAALCLGYILIANSFSNALLPITSSKSGDAARRRPEFLRALKASSLLFIIYTAVLLAAGQFVINLVNPEYMVIFSFLPGMILSYVLIGYLTVMTFYVNSIGYQKYAVYAGAAFAFLNLVLNLYLTPAMLYWGALYSLMTSCAVSLVILGLLISKMDGYKNGRIIR